MDIRVAKIINGSKLVINRGRADGIQVGNRVLVYSIGEQIVDPETKESLGELEVVKGTGVITHLQDRIATVESDRKSKAFKKVIRKPLLFGFQQFSGEEEIIDPSETIPFDEPEVGDFAKIVSL